MTKYEFDKKRLHRCASALMALAVVLQTSGLPAAAAGPARDEQTTVLTQDNNSAQKLKDELSKAGNKVTQYYNEDEKETRTVLWTNGIEPPAHSSFVRTTTGNGEHIEYIAPYEMGNGWYDVNKTEDREHDQNLCFAAAASNTLHWWLDRNQSSIDTYLTKMSDPGKAGKLDELRKSFLAQDNSGVYKLFVGQFGDRKDGYWPDLLQDQFLNGYYLKANGGTNDSDEDRNKLLTKGPDEKGGFFYDVLGTTRLSERRHYYGRYDDLNRDLKQILMNGDIALMSYEAQKLGHVVTLWGAEYDPNGNLCGVYLTDSDDVAQNGMMRYKIVNANGTALISTRVDNQGAVLQSIQILSSGKKMWEHYLQEGKTELNLNWENTDTVYNGKIQKPTLSAPNLSASDDVRLTVDGEKRDAGTYTATAIIGGPDAYKYQLPADRTQQFTIQQAPAQVMLNVDRTDHVVQLSAKVIGLNRQKLNGTMTFRDGERELARVPVVNNVAERYTWNLEDTQAHQVIAEFTPASDNVSKNYKQSTSSPYYINGAKPNQEGFAIKPIQDKTFGDEPFLLETEGGNGDGEVSFWSDWNEVISVSGKEARITGVGTAVITATKAGGAAYNDATAIYEVTVEKAMPQVSLTATVVDNATPPAIILTARVTDAKGMPLNGTVKFVNCTDAGEEEIAGAAEVVLENGEAAYTLADMPPQLYTLKAVYNGDEHYHMASSAQVHADTSVGPEGTYTVSVETNGHGRASAEPAAAVPGTTVTLKAEPDQGFVFKRWEVLEGDVELRGNQFTMPDMPVKLRAVFEADSTSGGSSGGSGGGGVTPPAPDKPATETIQRPDGTVIEITQRPDGSTHTVEKRTDGTKVETTTDRNGSTTAKVEVPKGGDKITVTIPTPGRPGPGQVLVIVQPDGAEKVVPQTVPGEEGLTFRTDKNVTVKVEERGKTFADVPANSWARNAVTFVGARGLFNGISKTHFGPELDMTRGMLTVVLHNLESNPNGLSSTNFEDVAPGAWYAQAVQWAAAEGIVSGYGDGTFAPDDKITREQLAVMLYRYSGSPAVSNQKLNFADADQVSGFAHEALRWAVSEGIIGGKGNGVLDPKGTATRAEVAMVLMNFCETIVT